MFVLFLYAAFQGTSNLWSRFGEGGFTILKIRLRNLFQKSFLEAVNFIFYFGTKFAKPNRLTISEHVPPEIIPDQLKDIFINSGVFEDTQILHSKKCKFSSAE
jgi:hypothetical protein